MNIETLIVVVLGIIMLIYLLLPKRFIVDGFSTWSSSDQRGATLLRAVLTQEQYSQLIQRGYIDIASPSVPQRVYRVPQTRGLVGVIENDKLQVRLCVQTLEWVPDADIVVMHKLMIEADEEAYLQKANRIPPPRISRTIMRYEPLAINGPWHPYAEAPNCPADDDA